LPRSQQCGDMSQLRRRKTNQRMNKNEVTPPSKETERQELLDDTQLQTRDLPEPRDDKISVVKALAACALYFTVGPILIMVNKTIIKELNFVYPMTLAGMGLLSSTVVTQFLRLTGLLKFEKDIDVKTYMMRICPIGLFMAITLRFGNLVYLYMSVSLIQMLKAFTPAMTLALVWMAGLTNPTQQLTAAVFIMAIGTATSSAGADASNWSLVGFAVMFAAEFFEALKCMLMQFLLGKQGLKFSALEGLAYFAPTALFWMLFLISFMEYPGLYETGALQELVTSRPGLVASCFVLGFLVNIAGFLVIKTTSVVTLKILGQIRNVGLIVVNVIHWHEVVTFQQGCGYLVTMAGFAWYNYENLYGKMSVRNKTVGKESRSEDEPRDLEGKRAS